LRFLELPRGDPINPPLQTRTSEYVGGNSITYGRLRQRMIGSGWAVSTADLFEVRNVGFNSATPENHLNPRNTG
jgi:hypothetical protein